MDWVKSLVGYYRLLEIATGDDAMEVMFKRADALAGELGSDGFIPDAMLGLLTRRPAQAKKIADRLVGAGLWVKVRGGYMIVDWSSINAELVRLQDKKKRDRDRKRVARAAGHDGAVSADNSAPASADSPTDSLYESERKTQKKTAAAAAGAAAAAEVDGRIAVLGDKLRAHTALRGLRIDTLRPDQAAQLVDLIDLHGDTPLVDVALATCRHPAPTHVSAFLGTWAALPPPGRPLAVVRQQLCDTHGTRLTPSGTCSSCQADQKAAR